MTIETLPITRPASSIQDRRMSTDQSHSWDGFLCGCFVVLVILSSFPFAEMGFVDDFSYIKTAQEFARTGHVIYNGWAATMLGWQVPWGALFIKLFGVSFAAPRISTLFTSLFAIALFYAILGRFGIERRNAVFGSLLLGCSPIFIPLAASFMTDISGLFIILLCLYMCIRALSSASDRAAFCWLGAAALVNVAGGTVRQIAWLGTLVLVPCTAWLMRRRTGGLVIGLLIWGVGAAGVFGWMRWWQNQPYSVPEKITWPGFAMLPHGGIQLFRAFLCLCLLLLPLLAAWLKQTRMFRAGAWAAVASLTGMLVAIGAVLSRRATIEPQLMPWIGDVIAGLGTSTANSWMLGARPLTLGLLARVGISLAVTITTAVFLVYLSVDRDTPRGLSQVKPGISWRTTIVLLGPFTLAYIALLLPRASLASILDRYLVDLMPIAILCLLKLYQERVGGRLPVVSYALLAIFSIFAVAGTHDWFALQRARIRAGAELVTAGVPITHIQGGMDYDGWTQISLARSANEEKLVVPAGAYHKVRPSGLPAPCDLRLARKFPVITPEYFITLEDLPCLAPSRFGEVEYRAWWPPFRRAIYIQQRRFQANWNDKATNNPGPRRGALSGPRRNGIP